MSRTLRFFAAAVAAALIWSPAVSALAAPVGWQKVGVSLHPEKTAGVLLISGELLGTVSLPADAELWAPTGSEVQWIGQILGGPTSNDPELEYTKSVVGDMDVYRFTLTKSRVAQVEISTAEGIGFDGTAYRAAVRWKAPRDIHEVKVGVRLPRSATIVEPAPGASVQPGDSNYDLYSKTVRNVKAGDQLELAFGYALPTAPAPGSQAGTDTGLFAQIILILVAVGAFAATFVAVRRKMALKSSDAGKRPPSREAKADGANGAPDRSEPSAGGRGLTRAAKRNLIIAGIVGAMIVPAVLIGAQTTRPRMDGDIISRTFSQQEPCATAKIPLSIPGDADPATTAETLFAAIEKIDGLTTATFNARTSSIEIGFCESQTSEVTSAADSRADRSGRAGRRRRGSRLQRRRLGGNHAGRVGAGAG